MPFPDPEEEVTPIKKAPVRIGEHVFWLASLTLASATGLAAWGSLDGGQYLIVTTGILSIMGVKAANGK